MQLVRTTRAEDYSKQPNATRINRLWFTLVFSVASELAAAACGNAPESSPGDSVAQVKVDSSAPQVTERSRALRKSFDSAKVAMPLRSFTRRTDAEIGNAWRFATREANTVATIVPGDIAWIDGVVDEVRRRRIRPWLENVQEERAPSDLPPYKVEFKQRMIAPPGVVVEFVVPSLKRTTPQAELERVAFAIMRREGGVIAYMYSTRAAYLANQDAQYRKAHPGALEKGLLGRIEDGVFHGSPY